MSARVSAGELVRTFSAISAALNRRQPLAAVLDLIAEQVARTLEHRFCAIALYDEPAGSFSIRGSHGLSSDYIQAANQQLHDQIARDGLANAQSVTVRAFHTRLPVRIDDIATDPTFESWRRLAQLAGYSSAVFLPLVFRDTTIGVLSCYDMARAYSAEDVDMLRPVADQTATAVGIARLMERQQDTIETLEQTTRQAHESNARLRRTAEATRTLTGLLLEHCSLDQLVVELCRQLDRTVILCDENMRPLAGTPHDDTFPAHTPRPNDIVVPVEGGERTYGHLIVEAEQDLSGQSSTPMIDQAAMACALYFMREQAANERNLRLTSQLLHDLLNHDIPSTEIGSFERRLRLEEGMAYRIVRIVPPAPEGAQPGRDRRRMQLALDMVRSLGDYAGGQRPVAHAQLSDGVVAVVPDTGDPGALASAAHRLLRDSGAQEMHRVAVSRSCRHAGDFRRRYQELRKCQDLAGTGPSTDHTVLAEDWHLHTMLMRTADDQEVRGHAHEILDPVLADGSGGRLLDSLRVYLDTHTNTTRTASILAVHPNTVKYRLRKLERLTGLDLGRVQQLIELQLALAVHDLDPARFSAESSPP